MRFSEAMRLLEEGKRVRCKNWSQGSFWSEDTLDAKTQLWSDSAFRISWMMKEEWELYEEPEQMLSFAEVVKGLKEGKCFKRKGKGLYIRLSRDGLNICLSSSSLYQSIPDLTLEEFEANDWVEVE